MGKTGITLHFQTETSPECEDFLLLKNHDSGFMDVSTFVKKYPYKKLSEMSKCKVRYRDKIVSLEEYVNNMNSKFNSLKFVEPLFNFCTNPKSDKSISLFFLKRATDYLKYGRFYVLLSYPIFDPSFFLGYDKGYWIYYAIRCLYFQTAINWYASTIDQISQIYYWKFALYKKTKNYKNRNNIDKLRKKCNMEFVLNNLKKDNLKTKFEELYQKTNKLTNWNNAIKHRGGLDFQFLETPNPLSCYEVPVELSVPTDILLNSDKFLIKEFNGIEVDIDKDVNYLFDVHQALYDLLIFTRSLLDTTSNLNNPPKD